MSRRHGSINDTPLAESLGLSEQLQCKICIKDETKLPGRSHKYRGAYNEIAQLDPELCWKGVVTCSTGTLAQLPFVDTTSVF